MEEYYIHLGTSGVSLKISFDNEYFFIRPHFSRPGGSFYNTLLAKQSLDITTLTLVRFLELNKLDFSPNVRIDYPDVFTIPIEQGGDLVSSTLYKSCQIVGEHYKELMYYMKHGLDIPAKLVEELVNYVIESINKEEQANAALSSFTEPDESHQGYA